MKMNYSKQTYTTVIQQYEWRVQSLLNKIDELNARLEPEQNIRDVVSQYEKMTIVAKPEETYTEGNIDYKYNFTEDGPMYYAKEKGSPLNPTSSAPIAAYSQGNPPRLEEIENIFLRLLISPIFLFEISESLSSSRISEWEEYLIPSGRK